MAPVWADPVRELAVFRSLTPWRHAAIVLVAIATLLSAAAAVLGWGYANALDGMLDGSVSQQEAIRSEDRFFTLSMFLGLAWLAGVVSSVGWLYVASKNAEVMRPGETEHTPKWAILGWFVPILNLFRPVAMVQQAWSQLRCGSSSWAGVPTTIRVWWGFFVAHLIVDRLAVSLTTRASLLGQAASAHRWASVSAALLVPAGIAFVLVIHHVTLRHEHAVVEFSADPTSLAKYPRLISTTVTLPDNGAVLARNRGW